jgi:hypothetical protein
VGYHLLPDNWKEGTEPEYTVYSTGRKTTIFMIPGSAKLCLFNQLGIQIRKICCTREGATSMRSKIPTVYHHYFNRIN